MLREFLLSINLLMFFGLLIFSHPGQAITSFELENKSLVSFKVLPNWHSKSEMFGVPLMLLGPKSGKVRRPVLTLVNTGVEQKLFSKFTSEDGEAAYIKGRKRWLSRYDGLFIKSLGYDKIIDRGMEFHIFGYTYKLGTEDLIERSYYVVCEQELYHLKTLFHAKTPNTLINELEKTLNSFNCQGEQK